MKLCLVSNYAPNYRHAVYRRMSNELFCDFFCGTALNFADRIQSFSFRDFPTRFQPLKNNYFFSTPLYWQTGFRDFLGKYDVYIFLSEPYCISTWILCFLLKYFYRKKIVFWGHGWYGRESFIKKILLRVFLSLSHRMLVYGEHAINIMVRAGVDSRSLFPVHNSLDYAKQLDVISCMPQNNPFVEHFGNSNSTIIFSGRLTPQKRIDLIVEAAAFLKKNGWSINCVLIGDGSERARLESLVSQMGLDNFFWFYGACYDESTIGLMYWNASLCVSPGNVGLTAIHAMTYGCPVLTHNNFPLQMPEYESIIPGITGDFFLYNDIDSLAKKIREWTSISVSERKLCRMKCQENIKTNWTPDYQIGVINNAVSFNH